MSTAKPGADPQDEIDRIMNEIEELQQGMVDEVAAAVDAAPASPPPAASQIEESAQVDFDALSAEIKEMEAVAAPPSTPSAPAATTGIVEEEEAALPKIVAQSLTDLPETEEEAVAAEAESAARAVALESVASASPVPSLTPKAPAVPEATAEDDLMKDFHATEAGPGMEETLAELKEEESDSSAESSLLNQTYQHFEESHSAQPKSTPVAVSAPVVAAVAAVVQRSHAVALDEPEMESPEIPEALDEVNEEQAPMAADPKQQDHGATAEGTLSMTLTGNMSLKLRYEYEGQEVTIGFSDQFLKVQLSDGTEFKIPVGRVKTERKPLRRAA